MTRPVKMFGFRFTVFVFLSAAFLSFACAAQTSFLENDTLLRPGKFVEKFYVDNRALHQKGYMTLVVKDVDTTRIKDSWGMEPDEAANYLKRELQEAARRSQIERFFTFGPVDQGQAALEVAVTEQSSGSPIGRLAVAVLGWGQAYLRVEGRVRDLQSNQVIASFSHFKKSKAVWPLRDLGKDGGVVMLREMYTHAANEIIKEIGNSFGFIPATLKDDLPFKYT